MPADTRVISVSYTHLAPYRRHVLLLDTMSRQVRLIPDPRDFPVADSGWHGRHTWAPRTAAFVLDDLHYDGHRANFSRPMVFTLDGFSHKKNKTRTKQKKLLHGFSVRGAVGATLGATPLCQMTQWQRWCSRVSSLRVGLLSEWTSPRSRWWQSQSQPPRPPLARPAMIGRWLTLAAERAPRCPPSLLPWHRRAKRATFMQPSSMEL